MDLNIYTMSSIQNLWNTATAAIMEGGNAAEGIKTRAAIYNYIDSISGKAAETLQTDPAGAFSAIHRDYLLTDGDAKKVILSTPERIATAAARWSRSATYAEISPADALRIEEEEARQETEAEEKRKKAAFDAVQEYNEVIIDFLRDLLPIFKAFSGKVFNKKLDDALTAKFPYGPDSVKRCYINRQSYHPGQQYSRVDLILYTRDDNQRREYIKIEIDTEEGKQPRINYEKTAEGIKARIDEIKARIDANNAALEGFSAEVDAARKVLEAMEAYAAISAKIPDQFKDIYKLPHDIAATCGDYNAISKRNGRWH